LNVPNTPAGETGRRAKNGAITVRGKRRVYFSTLGCGRNRRGESVGTPRFPYRPPKVEKYARILLRNEERFFIGEG